MMTASASTIAAMPRILPRRRRRFLGTGTPGTTGGPVGGGISPKAADTPAGGPEVSRLSSSRELTIVQPCTPPPPARGRGAGGARH